MNTRLTPTVVVLSSLALLALAPSIAGAQDGAASEQPKAPAAQQAPLTLERINNSVVVAPDYKVTDIDGWTGQLMGGYAGWLADNHLLVGGAGYWLVNPNDEHGMWYLGALAGWQARGDRAIGFGARGLVGFGQARLSTQYPYYAYADPHGSYPHYPGNRPGTSPGMTTVIFDQDFFIFEPQGNVLVRLADRVFIDAGVGYRVIAAANGWEDRLRGVSGSVAIRFGLGGS
jgi:hypothetical protein